MKKIVFFGNYSKAFLSLVDDYTISFVVFETGKENQNIINYCSNNKIKYISVLSKGDIHKLLTRISEIDIFLVASFGLIFDQKILDFPKFDVINIHPGLLPQYRGRHPLPQAILNKELYMGLTSHVMSLAIDEGRILKIVKIAINYEKNYKDNELLLLNRLYNFVKESVQNYFNNVEITTKEKNTYYKPLDKDQLHEIFTVTKLKELK